MKKEKTNLSSTNQETCKHVRKVWGQTEESKFSEHLLCTRCGMIFKSRKIK